jgi:four helix bundle protein
MATIRRFEEIQAWQKARELVREIYQISVEGRLSRDFGLRDQICRAAVSAMSNIAEGFTRNSNKEFAHFLDIAQASATEVQSLLYVALDAGYINKGEFERLYNLGGETILLIGSFASYLRRGPSLKNLP